MAKQKTNKKNNSEMDVASQAGQTIIDNISDALNGAVDAISEIAKIPQESNESNKNDEQTTSDEDESGDEESRPVGFLSGARQIKDITKSAAAHALAITTMRKLGPDAIASFSEFTNLTRITSCHPTYAMIKALQWKGKIAESRLDDRWEGDQILSDPSMLKFLTKDEEATGEFLTIQAFLKMYGRKNPQALIEACIGITKEPSDFAAFGKMRLGSCIANVANLTVDDLISIRDDTDFIAFSDLTKSSKPKTITISAVKLPSKFKNVKLKDTTVSLEVKKED